MFPSGSCLGLVSHDCDSCWTLANPVKGSSQTRVNLPGYPRTHRLHCSGSVFVFGFVIVEKKVPFYSQGRTGTHCVAQVGLEVTAVLTIQSPVSWNFKRNHLAC